MEEPWRKRMADQVAAKERWQAHVRTRVAEIFRDNRGMSGMAIANMILDEPPAGFRLPSYKHLYNFVLAELKNLK